VIAQGRAFRVVLLGKLNYIITLFSSVSFDLQPSTGTSHCTSWGGNFRPQALSCMLLFAENVLARPVTLRNRNRGPGVKPLAGNQTANAF